MKNYVYTLTIKERGGEELDWREWPESYCKHSVYIEKHLSPALKVAKCGWDDVVYKVIKYPSGEIAPYMVLCINGNPERWIPVDGNSDGCNLQVLGENIW